MQLLAVARDQMEKDGRGGGRAAARRRLRMQVQGTSSRQLHDASRCIVATKRRCGRSRLRGDEQSGEAQVCARPVLAPREDRSGGRRLACEQKVGTNAPSPSNRRRKAV